MIKYEEDVRRSSKVRIIPLVEHHYFVEHFVEQKVVIISSTFIRKDNQPLPSRFAIRKFRFRNKLEEKHIL
jgi:hypothetical protein